MLIDYSIIEHGLFGDVLPFDFWTTRRLRMRRDAGLRSYLAHSRSPRNLLQGFACPFLYFRVKNELTKRQIMGVKSRTFDTPSANGIVAASTSKNYRVKLTDIERKKVEQLIRNAKSLQDIQRLEKELNEGRVPAAAQGFEGDAMEE